MENCDGSNFDFAIFALSSHSLLSYIFTSSHLISFYIVFSLRGREEKKWKSRRTEIFYIAIRNCEYSCSFQFISCFFACISRISAMCSFRVFTLVSIGILCLYSLYLYLKFCFFQVFACFNLYYIHVSFSLSDSYNLIQFFIHCILLFHCNF